VFDKVTKQFAYGAHTVKLETGEIARQSAGAVLCSIDDTVVLATVVARKEAKPGQDFFPLTVDYVEKTFAAVDGPDQTLHGAGYWVITTDEAEHTLRRLIW